MADAFPLLLPPAQMVLALFPAPVFSSNFSHPASIRPTSSALLKISACLPDKRCYVLHKDTIKHTKTQ